MKSSLFYTIAVCVILVLFSINDPQMDYKTTQVDTESIYAQIMKDSLLVTGWYYIVDNENGFKRQLDKTDEYYFIDPKPILVKEHFYKSVISPTNYHAQSNKNLGLLFQMNKKLWADATEKSIGKQLGLIIDNKLVTAPKVMMKIDNGLSCLDRGVYSRVELEKFMSMIK